MHFFKLSSLCLATVGLLTGAFSFANGSEHEDDLLDPSLDRPLPQYQSSAAPKFEALPKPVSPAAASPEGAAEPPVAKLTAPDFGDGEKLAPNPLRNLLGGKSESARSLPAQKTQSPEIEKEPAANSKELPTPPGYSSPFDPKPLSRPRQKQPSRQSSPKAKTRSKTSAKSKEPQREKKKTAKKAKTTKTPQKPTLNFNIYRDQSVYPLDPRKPNNPCVENCGCGKCMSKLTGFRGRPYQPQEPGGYRCGKKCPNKRPQASAYWPRPLSAKLDERHPDRAAARYSGSQQKRLTDCFDCLANFRLIDYHRTDNGYCGKGRDPYGCLGESKAAAHGHAVHEQAVEHAQFTPNQQAEAFGWYPTP